jgi:hypothetical protein
MFGETITNKIIENLNFNTINFLPSLFTLIDIEFLQRHATIYCAIFAEFLADN